MQVERKMKYSAICSARVLSLLLQALRLMFIMGCQFHERFPYENVEALARQSLAFLRLSMKVIFGLHRTRSREFMGPLRSMGTLSSTLHIFPRSDHVATQKIGSLAMMCRASSSGATVWPNGPTGAQRRFHSDQ